VSHLVIGLTLALVGSVALNASYLIQHAGSAAAPAIVVRHPLRTLAALLRSRLWLAGGVLGITGWAISIAALTQAPLSLVQAFLIGGIAVLAPVAVRVLGQRLTPRELAGISLVVVALLVLVIGRGRVGVHSDFHARALGLYLTASVAAGACLLLVRQRRTQMLAAAGGVLYGAADVAIKGLTGLAAHHGLGAAATSPWLIVTIATSVGAFFCFQRALQSGRPMPVIALMTAGNNIVSIIGGLAVFGDPLGHRPAMVLIHVAAFGLIVFAAWLLAPAQAAVAAPTAPPAGRPALGAAQLVAAPPGPATHDQRVEAEADRAQEEHEQRDDRGHGHAGREHEQRDGERGGEDHVRREPHSGSLRYSGRGRWRRTANT
jgi:drug/metabolite transporter (DMT)-like permease